MNNNEKLINAVIEAVKEALGGRHFNSGIENQIRIRAEEIYANSLDDFDLYEDPNDVPVDLDEDEDVDEYEEDYDRGDMVDDEENM